MANQNININLRPEKRDIIALLICVTTFLTGMVAVLIKYHNFGYTDWDLAFVSQAMWNLSNGSQFVTLTGINFFGDHSYYIALLLIPLFKLIPHPLTLVLLKLLIFVCAAFALYKYSKDDLGEATALMCTALYLTFPPNIFAILYEFNIESLSPLVIILLFRSFKKDHFKLFLSCCIVMCLIKENMCLVVAMFGIYAFVARREHRWRWGFVPLLLGTLTFYLFVTQLIPAARGLEEHAFVARYRHLGSSLTEIISTILLNPQSTLAMVFEGRNLIYMGDLFGGLLIPAILSPQILFLFSPVLLQHLLSNDWAEHTIYYHYASSMAPFIFLAAINTLAIIKKKSSKSVFTFVFSLIILLCVLHIGQNFEPMLQRVVVHEDNLAKARWQIVSQVPKKASIVATFTYLAPLSTRKHLYSFHTIYDEYYQNERKLSLNTLYTAEHFVLPPHVTYALIDFDDYWLKSRLSKYPNKITSRIEQFFINDSWSIVSMRSNIFLLKRNIGPVNGQLKPFRYPSSLLPQK